MNCGKGEVSDVNDKEGRKWIIRNKYAMVNYIGLGTPGKRDNSQLKQAKSLSM